MGAGRGRPIARTLWPSLAIGMVTDGRAASLYRHEYSTTHGSLTLVELALAGRDRARRHMAARWPRGLGRRRAGTRSDPCNDARSDRIGSRIGGIGLSRWVCLGGARVFVSHGPTGTKKMVHDHVI